MIIDVLDLGEQPKLKSQVVVLGSGIAGAEIATSKYYYCLVYERYRYIIKYNNSYIQSS